LDLAKGEYAHVYPWFLPDGRHFLYTALRSDGKEGTVYLADTGSSDHRAVLTAGASAAYAAPGYILYLRGRTLLAQAFDVSKAVTTGDAMPIAEQVGYMGTQAQGLFSVSQNGILDRQDPKTGIIGVRLHAGRTTIRRAVPIWSLAGVRLR
jgi:hypothetical protein